MSAAISLGISFVALTVSVYGIFERQRAAYSALRIRLTELLSSIEELNIRQAQESDRSAGEEAGDNPQTAQTTPYAFAGRRALLTYQALSLSDRLRKSRFARADEITAGEYGSLAYSLGWCGDLQGARRQWEHAVAAARSAFVPDIVRAANLRGLASTLMQLEQPDAARRAYRSAIQTETGESRTQLYQAFDTALQWLRQEKLLTGESRPELPVRIAHRIAGEASRHDPGCFDVLRRAASDAVFVESAGTYRQVTMEDLLEHDLSEILSGAVESG